MLTHTELVNILNYNPETGDFVWNRTGILAGSMDGSGYLQIKINQKPYKAHRLAWFYVYGTWPVQLDHVDCNRVNNRIVNLRLASRSQNQGNRIAQRNSRSGIKGVIKIKDRYRVFVARRHVGYFLTEEEARAAYATAAKYYFGEFYRGV